MKGLPKGLPKGPSTEATDRCSAAPRPIFKPATAGVNSELCESVYAMSHIKQTCFYYAMFSTVIYDGCRSLY